MDSFEKKVRELYQQQKREDEKSMPAFDAFSFKQDKGKTVKHSFFFLKVAASVVVAVATGLLFFHGPGKPGKETSKIYPVNINQHLPTQYLLDKGAAGEYIWNWKAPSDQLLEDAQKSVKTNL